MIRFSHDIAFFALVIIPVMVLIYIFTRYKRKKILSGFASDKLHPVLFPLASGSRSSWKFIFSLSALILLIIALSGPQIGSKLKEVQKQGREIIIALDVSNSMLAEDIKPNRLEKAKQSLNRLLNEMQDDRIGLIVFAGDAYTQIPVTNDYGAARLFLESVSPDMVSRQGTSISSAIELAMRSFSPALVTGDGAVSESRALIIITDGENHEDDPVSIAKNAAEKGIVIHTIGLGDPAGVPLPLYPGSKSFRKDKQGNVIVSKLDEATLRQIAAVSHGFYVRAGNNASWLSQLIKKLDEMDSQEYGAKVYAEYIERFQYFLGAALFLLILEFLISGKKNLSLEKIRLFQDSLISGARRKKQTQPNN